MNEKFPEAERVTSSPSVYRGSTPKGGREFVEVLVISGSFLVKSEYCNKLLRLLRSHLLYKQRRS